jgi:hypothetical protein
MRTETTVEIDRPVEDVFDYTTGHVAEWSKTVVEEEILDEKPNGVGTTFRIVTEERGRRMEFEGLVTRHEPPRFSAVLLVGPSFDIEAEYSFEDLSGRTRVTQRSSVTGKGFFRAVLFCIGWLMKGSGRRAQEAELLNLKRLLEAREDRAGA